jgi:hypothetical protein
LEKRLAIAIVTEAYQKGGMIKAVIELADKQTVDRNAFRGFVELCPFTDRTTALGIPKIVPVVAMVNSAVVKHTPV